MFRESQPRPPVPAGVIIRRTEIDPSDGMSFWHINEYSPKASNWHTRIGKFNFQGGGSSPTPSPSPTPSSCSWAGGPDMPRPTPALLESFSLLTGSFTSWAAVTSIMSSSLIPLSTTRQQQLDDQVSHLSRRQYEQHGLWCT